MFGTYGFKFWLNSDKQKMVKHIRVEATDEHPDWHQKGKLWKLIRKVCSEAAEGPVLAK